MPTVDLTEAAAHKVRQLLDKNGRSQDALRVRVINGGCSGMRYELLFDGETAPTDESYELEGVRILIDEESRPYLEGTTVDYADGLNESGFKIDNPKASDTCGCGESFNVA